MYCTLLVDFGLFCSSFIWSYIYGRFSPLRLYIFAELYRPGLVNWFLVCVNCNEVNSPLCRSYISQSTYKPKGVGPLTLFTVSVTSCNFLSHSKFAMGTV